MAAYGRAIMLAACMAATLPAIAQTSYWRCTDPANICIAYTEQQKADCPECKAWAKVFLDFHIVLESARAEQKEAGLKRSTVASNYFLDAASEKLYGVDLTPSSGGAPPKTREIYRNPEKFGLRAITKGQAKVGTLAVVGDIAGIVTEKDGELQVVYPSAKTGGLKYASPSALADSEKSSVKYFVPADRHD